MEQVEKWNDGFTEPLMKAQKEDAKKRERGVLRTQLKAVDYFRKKGPS